MRNNFLCYSIITMLNTIFMKTCSCRDESVTNVTSLSPNNMTLLFRSNRTQNCMTTIQKDSSIVRHIFKSNFLYTEFVKRTRKSGKRKSSWNGEESTPRAAKKRRHTRTKMPPQPIENTSNSIVNFKIRKKENTGMCTESSVYSSQSNGSDITSHVFKRLSSLSEVDLCVFQNKSYHVIRTLSKVREGKRGDVNTTDVCTNQKSKRTRRKKSSATLELNCSGIRPKSKYLSIINDTTLFTISKSKGKKRVQNTTEETHQKPDVNSSSIDLKRKLLRQELIELLRNQSLLGQKKRSTRKKLFAKLETVMSATITPSRLIHLAQSSTLLSASLFPPLAQNFLFSAEMKLNVDDSKHSESLLKEFDEIRLNPENADAKKLDLQDYEKFLYIPRNDSIKIYEPSLNTSTKKLRVTRPKLKSMNTTKSQLVRKRMVAESSLRKKGPTKKPQSTTFFDMYDFFLHQKPHQNTLLELQSTAKRINLKSKARFTMLKNRLNWKQFLMSPEEVNVGDIDPTVMFSGSEEAKQRVMNFTETMASEMVTLNLRELPNTEECFRLWNQTLTKISNESNIGKSQEICTLGSLEAMHIMRQNFSHFLSTKSVFSHLSPFHPLIHPFLTKFDERILPNAKEARAIIRKFFNESVELHDDYVATGTRAEETSVCPLKRLNEYDFADMSMSHEWKMLCDRVKWTTEKLSAVTDLHIEIPDTDEAETIFHQFNWPNIIKTYASRRNQTTTNPPRLSTLSIQESKLLLARLGVELFGQQFRINVNHQNKKKKHKVIHSKSKRKLKGRLLKHRKLEGYVVNMITDPIPSTEDQEVYVPWQSEESEVPVQLNFNMKLFLSKLCSYLSDSKRKNQTRVLPASKTARRSFLIGKPAYFKKRKNALI